MRLFQNFSFGNSFLRFRGKTGFLTGFSKSLAKTNRVLEQAQMKRGLSMNPGARPKLDPFTAFVLWQLKSASKNS
jgi:hypothetical protein